MIRCHLYNSKLGDKRKNAGTSASKIGNYYKQVSTLT